MTSNAELYDGTSILLHTADYNPIFSVDLNALKPKMGFIDHFCISKQFDFWSQSKSQWQLINLLLSEYKAAARLK
jgi:hypothetical protein